jgi:LuxR family maltose regulon positive regulatory protein
VPTPAILLHRPRVYGRLESGLECKLTIISAPAGYGKTSALIGFAVHSPVPVCWYTAEEEDRDLGMFIEYLTAAIAQRFSGFGARTRIQLSSLGGNIYRDPTVAVGGLVNEMVEIETPFVVVIDNYESLEGASGIRAFLYGLLDALPFNCHLMLGSRTLPDVPITRLVSKRQLVGMTSEDLRFAPQEIRDLLALSGVEIGEDQAGVIAASTEGWITGVLLLAERLRNEIDGTLLDSARGTVETYEYLAREVLSRHPPDIQHFLRTSAVLREMSPRACRTVLQIGESRTLLEQVERRNLFVTRYGRGASATYRYHNLFRDFLHKQLRQRDPSLYGELHLRAARYAESENDVDAAVYHYLAAGVYQDATRLIERIAVEWFSRGRVETLLRWEAALPEEARRQAPRLSLYVSKVLTDRYDPEGARRALAHAEQGFAERRDEIHLAKLHNQRALLGLFAGRQEEVVREAQMALSMLARERAAERSQAQQYIGRAYVGMGRLAEGITELQEALALSRDASGPYDVANLLQDLGTALVSMGRYDEALACVNEALAIGRQIGAPTLLAGILNNLGWLHYARGEYDESLALYEEGLAAARRGGDPRWQAYISVGMADLHRDVGAYERALPLYDAGWQLASESEPGLAIYVLTAQADMHRWQGEYRQALALLEEAHRLAERNSLNFERSGLLPMAEGITLVESGEHVAGLQLLSEAVRLLEQRQARAKLARARFLLAKAHLLAGDRSRAVVELRQALDLCREVGTDQSVIVEGRHAEKLLNLGAAEGLTECRSIAERARRLRMSRYGHGDEGVAPSGVEVERLEIFALGDSRILRDGRLVSSSDWRVAMAKELFFYILLHGPLERDAIGVVFWPDLPAKKMTPSFHTTLYRIRRALGGEAVVREDGRYRVGDVDFWFDVERFEALVERARLLPPHASQAEDLWRRAAALYRGDFLPDVDRVWCVPRREALREMYIESLAGIGQFYGAHQQYVTAIDWYRQALEVDDLREDIHRHIMTCYLRAGRRPEALAQYRQCEKILRDKLGIEPSVETNCLYESILGGGRTQNHRVPDG